MLDVTRLSKVIVLFIVILPLLIIQPSIANACSCIVPENVQEAIKEASAVVQGKVIALKEASIKRDKYDAALVEVTKSWKGNGDSQMIIYTSWSSCQFDFEIGKEYLLYPYEHEGRFEVINCGRSEAVEQAGADLLALGEGSTPTNIVNLEKEFKGMTGQIMMIAAIGIIASTGVWMFIQNSRNRRRN